MYDGLVQLNILIIPSIKINGTLSLEFIAIKFLLVIGTDKLGLSLPASILSSITVIAKSDDGGNAILTIFSINVSVIIFWIVPDDERACGLAPVGLCLSEVRFLRVMSFTLILCLVVLDVGLWGCVSDMADDSFDTVLSFLLESVQKKLVTESIVSLTQSLSKFY